MEIILYLAILLVSFYLMAQIVDEYFIDSLDKISSKLGMSADAAGATLMAVGSSAPELFIAIFSLIKAFLDPGHEHETIGIGTIVGSALFNILVIIGATGVAKFTKLAWKDLMRDLIFYSISIGLLIWAFHDFEISMVESLVFIVLYAIYAVLVINWHKINKPAPSPGYRPEEQPREKGNGEYKGLRAIKKPLDKGISIFFPKPGKYYGVFLISIVFIAILSWVLVESAIKISHILDVPKAVIGLTVLAIGTSVPDLLSSVIVAKQGRGEMAISNSVGSNIFDILIGLGLPWFITMVITGTPIDARAQDLFISSLILFGSVLLIIGILALRRWKLDYRSGLFFILVYAGYLIWEILHVIG
jgi:K+-dependent Na+/Ca+ exchanger-like protein